MFKPTNFPNGITSQGVAIPVSGGGAATTGASIVLARLIGADMSITSDQPMNFASYVTASLFVEYVLLAHASVDPSVTSTNISITSGPSVSGQDWGGGPIDSMPNTTSFSVFFGSNTIFGSTSIGDLVGPPPTGFVSFPSGNVTGTIDVYLLGRMVPQ